MNRIRILIVDDESDMSMLLKARLSSEGFDVEVAADGIEGLRQARQNPPHLVLLDIMMPGKDGYSTLLELKQDEELRGIPVVILTAKPGMRDLFEAEGVHGYVTKPFESDILIRTIREALANPGKIKGSAEDVKA